MGWKFSLAGFGLLALYKTSVHTIDQSPQIVLVILLVLAILGAFFFGGTGKDKL